MLIFFCGYAGIVRAGPLLGNGSAVNSKQHQRSRDLLIGLRRITQAIDLHSKKLSKNFGITGPQLVILQELAAAGNLTVSELSRSVSLSQGTVTEILLRLEKKGLIEKRRSETDKRKVQISITTRARQLCAQAPSPLQDRFIRSFHGLEEWEQLMILCSINRIVKLMSADEIEASPFLISGPIQTDRDPS